jgi:hypothetical protein
MRSRRLLTAVALVALGCTKPPIVGGAGPDASPPPAVALAADAAPVACHTPLPPEPSAPTPYVLRFDQLGYERGARVWGVILGSGQPAPHYRVYALATGCFVREADATAGPRVLDVTSRAHTPLTGDRIDLGAALAPGDYLVVLDDGARLGPLHVAPGSPYATSVAKVVRFLRAQRCGATDEATSLHPACHRFGAARSGDGVAVADGFGGPIRATSGPAVDVEGGWHDAGDYIKFTGTTAFVLATDLAALAEHREALVALLGRAGYDDLRTELRWGLDWMTKMVGGQTLYHQVSGPRDHDAGFRRPEDDLRAPAPGYAQRPVFRFANGRGANILGRAAAAFAAASQVYADDPAYAAALLATARQVYAAAEQRPAPQDPVPHDFYSEDSFEDDLALGAATLARVTGDDVYRAEALTHARALAIAPGSSLFWGGVESLALLETGLAFAPGSPERAEMLAKLVALAAPIEASAATPRGPGAAFGYGAIELGNGTIEQSLGAAAVCLAARRLAGAGAHDACIEVARSQLHWLYGMNPFGVSYQVGVGHHVQHPHHGLAETAHVLIDGAIVGGPTGADVLHGELPVPRADDPYARFSTDALLYEDNVEDWVVNEPAIDFTAPLVFVVAELAAATTVP